MTKGQAGFAILVCTVVWGLTFPIRQMTMTAGITPEALIFYSSLIYLVFCLAFFRKHIKRATKRHKRLGLIVGVFVAGGILLQTIGLAYTTPSSNAFFTVTNVIMVPFVALAMYREKPKPKVALCVPLCIVGVMILSGLLNQQMSFNVGDVMTLLAALCMAIFITILSNTPEGMEYQVSVTGAALMQTIVSGGLVLVFSLMGKKSAQFENVPIVWLGILFVAIIQMFFMNSLQYKAQQYIQPTPAALIMTMESVFGTLFSILFGIEPFTLAILVGGMLIIASVILMQSKALEKRPKISQA